MTVTKPEFGSVEVHVVKPFNDKDWEGVKAFAQTLAPQGIELEFEERDHVTKGKVLVVSGKTRNRQEGERVLWGLYYKYTTVDSMISWPPLN